MIVMNTVVTSREAILRTCREIVSEFGLSALTMRFVAKRCNVALGSIYNYFSSKNDLAIATIESVWQDIFHVERICETGMPFLNLVESIFERIKTGMIEYPNFFTAHSIGFAGGDKGEARQTMDRYFVHMAVGLIENLKNDPNVRADVFDEKFTLSDFVDFILSGVVSLLMRRKSSCAVLLEMIRRTIY